MKKITSLLAIVTIGCALFLGACKKEPVGGGSGSGSGSGTGGGGGGGVVITDSFDLVYTESGTFPPNAQTIFNAAPVGVRIPAYAASFPSNVDAELAANGTSRDKVISIKGKSLKVNIVAPAGQTMDFMDNVWVYVNQHNGNPMDTILFGSLLNYPTGLTSLDLFMTNNEVKEVFNADSVQLSLYGTRRAGTHTIAPNTTVEFISTIRGIFDVAP